MFSIPWGHDWGKGQIKYYYVLIGQQWLELRISAFEIRSGCGQNVWREGGNYLIPSAGEVKETIAVNRRRGLERWWGIRGLKAAWKETVKNSNFSGVCRVWMTIMEQSGYGWMCLCNGVNIGQKELGEAAERCWKKREVTTTKKRG